MVDKVIPWSHVALTPIWWIRLSKFYKTFFYMYKMYATVVLQVISSDNLLKHWYSHVDAHKYTNYAFTS